MEILNFPDGPLNMIFTCLLVFDKAVIKITAVYIDFVVCILGHDLNMSLVFDTLNFNILAGYIDLKMQRTSMFFSLQLGLQKTLEDPDLGLSS